MKEKIYEIFSIVMDVPQDQLNDNTDKDSLETWDSLQYMNLIFALEEAFDMKFTDAQIMEMQNLGEIVQAIEQATVTT